MGVVGILEYREGVSLPVPQKGKGVNMMPKYEIITRDTKDVQTLSRRVVTGDSMVQVWTKHVSPVVPQLSVKRGKRNLGARVGGKYVSVWKED